MLRFLLRDSERIGALAHATRKPAYFRRPHLACRTTAACRKREALRRCSGLSWGMNRPQPARHGARSQQARALCLLPRYNERSGVLAHATQKLAHSWRPQLARRITAARRNREASGCCSGRLLRVGRPQPTQLGALSSKLACCASFLRDTERIGALAHSTQKPAHSWRPQLARRTTAARRKREASGWCSGRLLRTDRLQLA